MPIMYINVYYVCINMCESACAFMCACICECVAVCKHLLCDDVSTYQLGYEYMYKTGINV